MGKPMRQTIMIMLGALLCVLVIFDIYIHSYHTRLKELEKMYRSDRLDHARSYMVDPDTKERFYFDTTGKE